jgi:dTDP-4-dehydrorhamnose reductase
MRKTILITGAGGMLAQDAAQIFADSGYEVLQAKKSDLDVTNLTQIRDFFSKNVIDFVFHAAAYTKVDDAETNQELAFLVNSKGAKNVAIATREKSIPIIYISTDYVFDGEKGSPYLVDDKKNPINVYGASKAAGEEEVKKENPMHYIARTSWLYGKNGPNFVDTMLKLAKTQKEIRVVNDQFGCPTWTVEVAARIKKLIEDKAAFGTYHLCSYGVASWFDLAKKIFEIAKIDVEVVAVNTDQFLRPARRPKFSAMESNKAIKDWKSGLEKYLNKLCN